MPSDALIHSGAVSVVDLPDGADMGFKLPCSRKPGLAA
jgi:hypothetical protein